MLRALADRVVGALSSRLEGLASYLPRNNRPGRFLVHPLPADLAAHQASGEPMLRGAGCQVVTARQFDEPEYVARCAELGMRPFHQRKQWEWVYIMQVLEERGLLRPGARGLGFGCGTEPMVAAMAARGCQVVATDLDAGQAADSGWVKTGQHASRLSDLGRPDLCPPETFSRAVAFRPCDMNAVPADLAGFDFLWSSCALEHLGSLEHGWRFVESTMSCLKPGGVAVHTTELNLASNERTEDRASTCIYRRRDVEDLARRLLAAGHRMGTINFRPGLTPVDRYVDLPPYKSDTHLRLRVGRYLAHLTTSFGFWVQRGEG